MFRKRKNFTIEVGKIGKFVGIKRNAFEFTGFVSQRA